MVQEEEKLRGTDMIKQMPSVARAVRKICPCLAEHIWIEAEDELGDSLSVYFPVRKESVHLLISSLMLTVGSVLRIGWKSHGKQSETKPSLLHSPDRLSSPVLSTG